MIWPCRTGSPRCTLTLASPPHDSPAPPARWRRQSAGDDQHALSERRALRYRKLHRHRRACASAPRGLTATAAARWRTRVFPRLGRAPPVDHEGGSLRRQPMPQTMKMTTTFRMILLLSRSPPGLPRPRCSGQLGPLEIDERHAGSSAFREAPGCARRQDRAAPAPPRSWSPCRPRTCSAPPRAASPTARAPRPPPASLPASCVASAAFVTSVAIMQLRLLDLRLRLRHLHALPGDAASAALCPIG